MSEQPPSAPDADVDDDVIATISDYLDGVLAGAARDEVTARIERDPVWKRTHEELLETRKFMSGLQKARAPATFAQDVTSTIHKRSAGRFFARRTLGDRVPFGALLLVALLALAAIGYVLWSSQTGSLKVQRESHPTSDGSGAPAVAP
jgi:anti-sigma factor RsiW